MNEEFSRLDQILRTPWLFLKNIPQAFIQSVTELPGQVASSVKGVTTAAGEAIGEGVKAATRPVIPVLVIVGILALIILGIVFFTR